MMRGIIAGKEENMEINEIKAKKIYCGLGSFAWIAEAEVKEEGEDGVRYVTVQYYDGEEYTVTNESLYDALVNDGAPVDEFVAEYAGEEEAKKSAYADVFSVLTDAIEKLR